MTDSILLSPGAQRYMPTKQVGRIWPLRAKLLSALLHCKGVHLSPQPSS